MSPPEDAVVVVAYGDQVHLYAPSDDRATIVYTVAVGSNLDAEIGQIRERDIPALRAAMSKLDGVVITDHRRAAATPGGGAAATPGA